MKRYCNLCGKLVKEKETRWMYTKKHQSGTMIAALLASNVSDVTILKSTYEADKRIRLCHTHFMQAARFIGAGMAVRGYHFPQLGDLSTTATPVITAKNIHSDILATLNGLVHQFDEELTLTPKQVAMFMQDCVKKYYTCVDWAELAERALWQDRENTYDTADESMSVKNGNGTCIICDVTRPLSCLHRLSVRRPWNLIMLSCLARHQLICVEDALIVYQAACQTGKSGRPLCCNSHYVEVAVLLGQEIERFGGEFPYCGLGDVPAKTMDDFMAVLRTCGKLLDSEMELREQDAKEFYIDCFRKHKRKIRDRIWRMKREGVQEDYPVRFSPNSSSQTPAKKRFENSDFVAYPIIDRFMCVLCGDRRLGTELRISSKSKKRNLLLLACQLASNSTGPQIARKAYSDISSTQKCICKEHYIQSVIFIGDEVKKSTGKVPILGLDSIPLEEWQNVFEKIQASSSVIDNERFFDPHHVIKFYHDCLATFRTTEGWEIYVKECGYDATALPSTSGVSSSNSDTSSVSDCGEPVVTTRIKLESAEYDDEELRCLDNLQPTITSTQQQTMSECCICAEPMPQEKCCSVSGSRKMNLLFISCLVMGKSFDLDFARSVYSRIIKPKSFVCKGHYIYAGIVIRRELERFRCSFPTHSAGVTLRFTLLDVLMKIRAVAVLIDNEVALDAADVERFHNECSSGLPADIPPISFPPKYESDPVEESDPLFSSNVMEPNFSSSNIKKEVKEVAEVEGDNVAISDQLSDEDTEENLADNQTSDEDTAKVKQRNRKCILCGFFHPEEEGRAPSSNVRQNVILLSCLVLTGAIKIDFVKGNYQELVKRHRRYCKQHYVQSANWIGEEVEKAWGRFPIHGLYGVSRKVMAEVLARLQNCADEFGEEDQLTADDLAWFYGECLGKYRRMDGWKAEALQSKEDINQAYLEAIETIIKESVPTDNPGESSDPSKSESTLRQRKGKSGKLKCALCSNPRHNGNTRRTTFDRMENALLLSSLVMKGVLDLKLAITLYTRFFVERKSVCKHHYDDAVGYINQELSVISENASSDNSNSAIEQLLSRLQSISHLLDRNLTLRPSCLVQFNKEFVAHPLESRKRKKIADIIVQVLNIAEKQSDRNISGDVSKDTLSALNHSNFNSPIPDFEAGPSQDCSNNSDDAGSVKLRTKPTPIDTWKIARNYTCALCGNFLSLGETCMSGVSNTRTLFILYRVLKFRILSLQTVIAFYTESLQVRQRICWKHFWKTAIYISKFLKKECLSSVQNGLENISQFVLNDMLEDVRQHLAKIYESKPLSYDDLVEFLEYCLNSQKARDGDLTNEQVALDKSVDEPEPMFGSVKEECSSSSKFCEEKSDDKRHPSSCGFCKEGVPKKNTNATSGEVQKRERKTRGKVPARRYWCPLRCGSFPQNEMRWLSMKANQTLTLLCCLCMDNIIDIPTTERLYKKGRGVLSKSICEYHYVQAAAYIGKEMEYMYGEFPRDGLQNVPKDVIEKFAYRVRLYRDKIDSRVVLTSYDIVEFFNDCLARYYEDDGWMAKKTVVGSRDEETFSKKKMMKVCADNSVTGDEGQGDGQNQEESSPEESTHLEGISAADLLAQSSQSADISLASAVDDARPSCSIEGSADQLLKTENSIVSAERSRLHRIDEVHVVLPPLTDEQRFDRLKICAGLLQRSSKESLLSRLVTCGEKWILYDAEKQIARCIDEKDAMSITKPQNKLKLLIVWWSAAGLIHYKFFKEPLTPPKYCQELSNMHKKLLANQKAMFYGRCPVLLHDDTRPYVKAGSIRSLYTLGYEVLAYPSQSQDLLPTEFHLFSVFNNFLAAQKIDCENIEGAFERFLRSRPIAFFNAGMSKLKARWHKCYSVDGDYFKM